MKTATLGKEPDDKAGLAIFQRDESGRMRGHITFCWLDSSIQFNIPDAYFANDMSGLLSVNIQSEGLLWFIIIKFKDGRSYTIGSVSENDKNIIIKILKEHEILVKNG